MPVSTEGFQHMYGLGEYDFNLTIAYNLPSVSQAAYKQGYTEEAIYTYTTQTTSFQVNA